jgi:hypothetical protein
VISLCGHGWSGGSTAPAAGRRHHRRATRRAHRLRALLYGKPLVVYGKLKDRGRHHERGLFVSFETMDG